MDYPVGMKVWALCDGFPWWPAEVVEPEAIGFEPESGKVFCRFYGSNDAFVGDPNDADHIIPLDFTSDKAKLDSRELQEALALARGDDSSRTKRHRDEDGDGIPPTQILSGGADVDMDEAAMLLDDTPAEKRDHHHHKHKKDKKDKKDKHKERNKDRTDKHKQHSEVVVTHTGDNAKRTPRPSSEAHRSTPKPRLSQQPRPSQPKLPEVLHSTATSESEVRRELGNIEMALDDPATPNVVALREALVSLAKMSIDFDTLRSTRIGVAVTKVTRNPACSRVRALAQALILMWIGTIPDEARQALRTAPKGIEPLPYLDNGGLPATSLLNGSPSDAGYPNHIHPVESQQERTRDRREFMKVKLVEVIRMPNVAEDIVSVLLQLHPSNAAEKFKKLEAALRKNAQLCEDVSEGAIPALDLLSMTEEELMPLEQRQELERIRREDTQRMVDISENTSGAITNMYECSECGAKEATFYQQQMRSADEPPTMFLTCLQCKFTWRED